jgi:hypothetical protein
MNVGITIKPKILVDKGNTSAGIAIKP